MLTIVKATFFPIVTYGCDSRTIKKTEWRGMFKATIALVSCELSLGLAKFLSWENMETVTDFIFLGSKITAEGDSSHEIKRRLLLGRIAMTNLDSILKSRDITLLTKVCMFKAMVFPVVMYGCESGL